MCIIVDDTFSQYKCGHCTTHTARIGQHRIIAERTKYFTRKTNEWQSKTTDHPRAHEIIDEQFHTLFEHISVQFPYLHDDWQLKDDAIRFDKLER